MQRLSKHLALGATVCTLLFAGRGAADDLAGFGGGHAFSPLHSLDSSSEKINIHPFSAHPSYGRAWSGFHSGALSFGEAMRRVVAAKTGAVEVEVRVSPADGGSQDVRFYVGNVPICGYHVRAQEVAGRKALALGNAPRLKSVVPTSMGEWPDRDVAYDVAKAQVQTAIDNFAGPTKLGSSSRCYVVQDQTLLPAWKMQVIADGLPYEVLADDRRAFQADRAFFDVDGTAKVYPLNKVVY